MTGKDVTRFVRMVRIYICRFGVRARREHLYIGRGGIKKRILTVSPNCESPSWLCGR